MDAYTASDNPILPSLPTMPSDDNKASPAVVFLVFMATAAVVFILLRLLFPPNAPVAADNTVGRVSSEQCPQMGGKIITLPSGHRGCQVEVAIFSLTD